MNRSIIYFLQLMLVLTLSGCFTNNNEPSTEDISNALKFELPNSVALQSFQIEVSENIGNKAEPLVRTRFKAKALLTENLYTSNTKILNKNLLKGTLEKNREIAIFGISYSEYKMDRWDVKFDKINMSPNISGKPLSNWASNEIVISGTDDEKALIKEQSLLEEKKISEKRNRLISTLKSKKAFTGMAGDPSAKWPFKLFFENFNPQNESFTGKMEWPSLEGTTKIRGNLIGNTIVFKEVAHIKKGDVILNTVYEINSIDDNKMSGTWNNMKKNWIWFEIN